MPLLDTLEKVDIKELTEVFNSSFSDYLVPFVITEEQLSKKMLTENIRLDYSIGAFSEGKLVGFILHFFNEQDAVKSVYNGGTGVIKEFRGKKLTTKMYDFILPKLKQDGINTLVLEVLEENFGAIKSYKNVGFQEYRILNCFKGEISITKRENTAVSIEKLNSFDWKILQSFWDFTPTWQNSIQVMEILKSNCAYGASINKELIGYIIYNPDSKRIQQLAVNPSHRNNGVGSKLIEEIIKENGNQLSLINVDDNATTTKHFLTKIGFEKYINQLEMKFEL